MSKTAIVTDSTAYLPEDILKQYSITVIPLAVIWDNETLRDGVDIQPNDFYKRLATSKTIPTTSQVTIADMQSTFSRLLEQGKEVLGIFISSKLSGTIDSAVQARAMLPKSANKIAIVDSLATTMAMGWPVLVAARAAQAGASLADCQKAAENACANSGVLFVVDTLEFLRRGGRIGGAQAFLGSALNIKPILALSHGAIEPVEKVRTKSKAVDRLIELAAERIGGRTPVRVAAAHANAEAEATAMLAAVKTRLNPIETMCCPLSPAIGTHTGPGTIALNYLAGVA